MPWKPHQLQRLRQEDSLLFPFQKLILVPITILLLVKLIFVDFFLEISTKFTLAQTVSLTLPNGTNIDEGSGLIRNSTNTSIYYASVTLTVAGSSLISATLLGVTVPSSIPLTVKPAQADHILVFGLGASFAIIGSPASFEITVYDAYGNLCSAPLITLSVSRK